MARAESTNPADGLDRDLSRDNSPDEPTRLGRAVVQFSGIYLKLHDLQQIIGYDLSNRAQSLGTVNHDRHLLPPVSN
jgi:hypothetical protein